MCRKYGENVYLVPLPAAGLDQQDLCNIWRECHAKYEYNTHTPTHTHTSHTSSCVCVCVCVIQVMTNKGRFVVTASDDCTARVWDLHADMSTHAVDCHTSRIRAVSDAARWW